MGKPVTEEQKYQVISKWYQGYRRDEIAEITRLSKGTISNILKEFKEKMEQGDFEAIQIHARLNRQFKLDHEKMLEGHRTNQILEKNGVTPEKLNSVIESCGKVIKSEDISSLLAAAVEIQEQKEKTGQTIAEIKETSVYQSNKITELDEQIKSEQQDLHNITQQKQDALDDANATQEVLDLFVKANNELSKVGLTVLDFVKAPRILAEFAKHNFDPKKIVEFFENVQDLSKSAKFLETKLQNLHQKISEKETRLTQITKDLDELIEKHKNYSKAAKIIQAFIDSNQDPNTIVAWETILSSAGVDIATFGNKLKEHKGIVALLRTLKEEIENLQTLKEKLLTDVNSFAKILQELQNNKNNLDKKLEQLLSYVSKEIAKYEDSNLFRIIRDPKCDLHKATLIIALFLKELKKSAAANTNQHVSSIQSKLDSLIADFERGVNSK